MKLDSRHILILLGLALALSSCVQFSGQEGMAQLYPPVFEVDATVEDLAQTKAAPDAPVPDKPALPNIHFTVKDKDGNVVYDKLGVWDDPLKLPIGAYSIEAYSGSNTFGSPYFTGTASGTVAGGKEETPKITMKLQNAYLAVGLTDNLAEHFKTSGNCITISTASASIDTGLDTYVFVPSGQELSITISGTSSADIAKTITHSLTARTAATATYLSCDLTKNNAPTITLKGTPEAWGTVGYIPVATTAYISPENVKKMVYIAEDTEDPSSQIQGKVEGTEVVFKNLIPGKSYSVYATIGALKSSQVVMTVATPEISISTGAKHTTNSSSELDGTDFTASISIPDKFKGVVANVKLTLSNGTTALREKKLSASETVWTSDGSVETAWPYLPKGSYTLTGTVSYNNGTKDADLTKLTLPVDAPSFTVNKPSAHTSYNTYLTSGAAAANKEDGSTIYGIANNGVKISSNILQNANYSSLIGGYTYFIDENSVNEGNNANQSWAAHDIVVKYTFNGVTLASKPCTCHVTGLPYRAPSETAFNASGKSWSRVQGSTTAFEITANAVQLESAGGDLPKAASPQFHIPSSIGITISGQYYKSSSGSTNYKFSLKTYNGSSEGEEILSQTPSGKGKTDNFSCYPTFTSDMPYIIAIYGYGWGVNYVEITSLDIIYRNS